MKINKKSIKYGLKFFEYFDNPISCLLFEFGIKKKCKAKIKLFNEEFEFNDVSRFNSIIGIFSNLDYGKYEYFKEYILSIDSETINVADFQVLNEYANVFLEYFTIGNWNVDVNDRYVIDIGANVGDTALIFASEGAKMVYGFEPVKELYEIGVKNIELNPKFSNKIKLVNNAVSYKKGKLEINNLESTSSYRNEEEFYEVDIITMDEILNDYDIIPDVLKIDCEGCEFEIIKNSDLSMFNDIIFEHHSGNVEKDFLELIKILEKQNFKVKTYPAFLDIKFEKLGIIHAYKD
ncbi:FkbM family methyltransferase [Methanobrevibacter sp. DSM 116169]|uniref:FkbM family methyltransferase n=1 Tax=Methanobrevibacter sp. DSM 116169 TaxID=3242727 RepID=UPI0038FCF75B